jgi:hypothetical protein
MANAERLAPERLVVVELQVARFFDSMAMAKSIASLSFAESMPACRRPRCQVALG